MLSSLWQVERVGNVREKGHTAMHLRVECALRNEEEVTMLLRMPQLSNLHTSAVRSSLLHDKAMGSSLLHTKIQPAASICHWPKHLYAAPGVTWLPLSLSWSAEHWHCDLACWLAQSWKTKSKSEKWVYFLARAPGTRKRVPPCKGTCWEMVRVTRASEKMAKAKDSRQRGPGCGAASQQLTR